MLVYGVGIVGIASHPSPEELILNPSPHRIQFPLDGEYPGGQLAAHLLYELSEFIILN